MRTSDHDSIVVEPKYKRRLAIVLTLSIVCYAFIGWLVFNPRILTRLGKTQIFAFMVALMALIPIYPLFRARKKFAKFRLPLCLLAVVLILDLILVIPMFVLQSQSAWVNYLSNISSALFLVSSSLFVWTGLRHKPEKDSGQKH